jgi:hypothetical protein
VIFDTVRAWCPQAERDPAQANEVMGVVREELTAPGLGVLLLPWTSGPLAAQEAPRGPDGARRVDYATLPLRTRKPA